MGKVTDTGESAIEEKKHTQTYLEAKVDSDNQNIIVVKTRKDKTESKSCLGLKVQMQLHF